MTDKGKKNKKNDKKAEVEEIPKQTEPIKTEEKLVNLPQPKIVIYCQICTFPTEYCDYSHDLLKKRKELAFNAEALAAASNTDNKDPSAVSGQTTTQEEVKIDTTPKPEEEKKETKEKKHKKITDKIHIKNTKRGKRKAVTVIKNIEKFGLDLKEVGKLLSKKFACSSTVNKDEENKDAIFMTGEFEDDLVDFLMDKFKTLKIENFHIDRIKKKEEGKEDDEAGDDD